MSRSVQVAQARQLFDALGFTNQPIDFDSIVTDNPMKKALSTTYRESKVSRVLGYMPDLLILHREAEPDIAAFFVRLLRDAEEPSTEEKAIYRKYYPEKLALIRFRQQGAVVKVTARWWNEAIREERTLAAFVKGAIKLSVSSGMKDAARAMGLLIS